MRRSNAPSLKQLRPSSLLHKTNGSLQKPENNGNFIAPRKVIQIPREGTNDCDVYNVVWNKITTKKHKTWEGDGILEVKNTIATLKDLNGTILSTESGIKSESLYDGNRLIIGSKEVEIQEKVTNKSEILVAGKNITINKKFKTESEFEIKKRKFNSFNKTSLYVNITRPVLQSKNLTKSSTINDHVPLILPPPSYSHQWKFNDKKNPVNTIKVCDSLVKFLRPHQREGVVFLYECLLGYRDENYFGAILADEMGLGKTLQCLTICHTLLKQGLYGEPILRRILIVTPSSLTGTWNREICKWLQIERLFAYVVNSKNSIRNYTGQIHVPFVIASYETVMNNCDEFKKLNFDLMICDEGHRLKNNTIKTSRALQDLNIKRKIILSGTPIQNDLQEFFMLVDFVNPGVLGSYNKYKQQYENPIVQSQDPNASEEVKNIGRGKTEKLNQIINKFVLRRMQSVNNEYLPNKREIIVLVRPSELQQFLLKKVLEWYNSQIDAPEKDISPFQIISIFKKICNHPSLLRTTKKDSLLNRYLTKLLPEWSEMGPFDSGKLELIQNFLQERIINTQEKTVLVSNHTKTLNILMELCDHLELKYLRLDGKTQIAERNSFVEKFNKNNSEYQVFLLSAKAGGVGLNLHGASNLILFDNDWNPATDLQAISRIWRDGQRNNVKIYRLITAGTIEEKIFQRQVKKMFLSDCIINQNNNSNNEITFSNDELKDLFSFQNDFNDDNCSTHELLKCNCKGDGKINEETSQDQQDDDPFGINLLVSNSCGKKNTGKSINELKCWEHYKPPIDPNFLQDIGLKNAEENIIFIFSHQIEFRSKEN